GTGRAQASANFVASRLRAKPTSTLSQESKLHSLGCPKQIRPQPARLWIPQPMFRHRRLESFLEQLRPGTAPAHAAKPVGVIVAAAAQRADDVHHLGGPVRIMFVEPGPE